MATSDRVRLIVSLSEGGFQIRPAPPLPDVEPGEQFHVTCWPQCDVKIRELLVRDYQLIRVVTEDLAIESFSRVEVDGAPPLNHWTLWTPAQEIPVMGGRSVTLTLQNEQRRSLRPYSGTFVRFLQRTS